MFHVFGSRVTFEVKAEDGKLTHAQFLQLARDYRAGLVVSCGTLQDLRILLPVLRRSAGEARLLGWRTVQLWAARGFRDGKKKKYTAAELAVELLGATGTGWAGR